jgi:replicative DNA helicase
LSTTFNVEKLLISKIIQERSLKEAADIQAFFIRDPDIRAAFEDIREQYTEHGIVPTVREFKADHPKLTLHEVDESWGSLVKRVQEQYLVSVLNENLAEVDNAVLEGDIDGAINFLGMTLTKVYTSVVSSRDVDVTQNGPERLERYLERRNNPGTLVGIPTGFPTIDRATQGLQPGQLTTITGLPKSSKSTIAMLIAMHVQEQNKRVLYLTFEQTVEEQERRLDAYRAGFNENKINSGDLTEDEWIKLNRSVHLTENLAPLMIVEDCMTVSAVGAKIDTFKPDVVIVDGVYMMDDERGQERETAAALANIVNGFKFLAMRRSISIVVVTQSTAARTKGEMLNGDSMKGSRAFSEYSNTVIGVERLPEVEGSFEEQKLRKLKILMARSCANVCVTLLFDYDTGKFEELEDFNPDSNDRELTDEGYETPY